MQTLFCCSIASSEGVLPRLANPSSSGVSVSPAHLLKKRTQPRQLSAIKAGDDIGLSFLPVRQRMEEDRLTFPGQSHVTFA